MVRQICKLYPKSTFTDLKLHSEYYYSSDIIQSNKTRSTNFVTLTLKLFFETFYKAFPENYSNDKWSFLIGRRWNNYLYINKQIESKILSLFISISSWAQ